MIGLIITLATIASYFAIGFTWSKRMLPKWWKIARREWKPYSWEGGDSRYARASVRDQFFWKAVCWPVFMTLHWIDLDRIIDDSDPVKLRRDAEQREKRIRDLERELGIR